MMVRKNGKQPEFPPPPTIEIDGETYEARSCVSLSHAEEIRANKVLRNLTDLGSQLDEFAEMSFDLDSDDDDDEPPEELVAQYTKEHLHMMNFGFPTIPKGVLRKLRDEKRDSEISQHAGVFLSYMQEVGEIRKEGAVAPNPTKRASAKTSSG